MLKKFLYSISLKKYIDDCVVWYEYNATEKYKRFTWNVYFWLCIYSFTITMILLGIILD